MKVQIEIDEQELRKMVKEKLESTLNIRLLDHEIMIEVKSKQNYKSEWENASFRARVNKVTQE